MSILLNPYAIKLASYFSPDDVAGLQVWFKADSLALADNDPIGTWEDSAGTNDATQNVAGAKPTFKTAIFGTLPAARCDGGDFMALGSAVVLSGAYTLYAVGARAGSALWIPASHDVTTAALVIFSDNNIYVIDDAVGVSSLAYTGSTGSIVTRWHRSAVGATNKFRATGMAEADVGIRGTISLNNILARGASAQFSTGDFAELLLWNVDLTGGEMTQVESYLTDRWGVSL